MDLSQFQYGEAIGQSSRVSNFQAVTEQHYMATNKTGPASDDDIIHNYYRYSLKYGSSCLYHRSILVVNISFNNFLLTLRYISD